jgi:FixJ family two-component response regulator
VSSKPLISIVDDDESVREATRGLMNSLGLAAEAFPSGGDFLESGRVQRTSCLIVDMQMPGMYAPERKSLTEAAG